MSGIHTVLNVLLYVFILLLVSIFASTTGFLIRKFAISRVSIKSFDLEANNNSILDEAKPSPPGLPENFYLDPIVYPSAAKRSLKRPLSQRATPNPFISPGNPAISEIATTTTAPSDDQTHPIYPPSPPPSPVIPIRPPRPTRLGDLLAGFPHEEDVIKDVWFPLLNKEAGRWELAVVRNNARGARLHRNSKIDQEAENRGKVVMPFVTVQEANTVTPSSSEPLETAPDNQNREVPAMLLVANVRDQSKSGKSSKRRHRKNVRDKEIVTVHVFEIPELHVNARPYAEIEAEEEARAAAIAAAASTSCP
ncbi:hypothetical protein AX15_007566 [Amanita polypyramis BW_CC]|nr:hypothetical protein AX15_007566 [Amanita polypyramis BW_CC]